MQRRRTGRRAAAGLLAVASIVALDGCSMRFEPGIRRTEGGDLEVRTPDCYGGSEGPVVIEVQRWRDDQDRYETLWRVTSPPVTPAGDHLLELDEAGLDPTMTYHLDVEGVSPDRSGSFAIEDLPRGGAYDLGGEAFPATAAGRADLDEAACDEGDVDWGGIAVVLGIMGLTAVVGLGVLIGGAVIFARWLNRQGSEPPPPPPPYWGGPGPAGPPPPW